MALKEVPVLLLTGYLGSGKTTLLNRILGNKKGIRFAVIVNDIGEVNIDADLIQQGGIVDQKDDSLVALQNGCICCTLKMDLVEQLTDLVKMQQFDYIVIEASGICEPAPIAQTICSIPTMEPKYWMNGLPRLDCIVTVVDALRMKDEFGSGTSLQKPDIGEEDIENLVIQQMEFCNIVLLNKAAEVEPGELSRIKQIVRAIQPKAEIIECNYGDVDFDKILRCLTSTKWQPPLPGLKQWKANTTTRMTMTKKKNIIITKKMSITTMTMMTMMMTEKMSTPTMPIMPMKAMATITSITTIIITMKVRLRNMASAPMSILPAAP